MLVDRRSKYVIIQKINRKTAENVNKMEINALNKLKLRDIRSSSTTAKGFARHQELKKNLGADIYFAKSYKACDRGINEHTNDLI